jgi:hypothetical protein
MYASARGGHRMRQKNNIRFSTRWVCKCVIVKYYVNECEHISLRFSSAVLVAQNEGIYLLDEIVTDRIASLPCRQ